LRKTGFPVPNLCIGIAGPSCSGKTTLTGRLSEILGAKAFSLDDYYIRGSKRQYGTCERPENYDGAQLSEDIARFAAGEPGRPIIVEGFLLFLYLCLSFSHRFFIDVPEHIAVARRRARMNTPMGKPSSIEEAWLQTGLAEWRQYGAGQANLPGVVHLPYEGDSQLPECLSAIGWRA